MTTEDKSIKRRRGTESALKSTGQLIDGQAGFCSDKKKILFKRPATWTSPGTIDEYDFDGLQTQITTEADARSEDDSTLQSTIDAEGFVRASADKKLKLMNVLASDTSHVCCAFPASNTNKYYLLASFAGLASDSRLTVKFSVNSFFNDLQGYLTITITSALQPKIFYEQTGTSDNSESSYFFPTQFIIGFNSATNIFYLYYFTGGSPSASCVLVLQESILNNATSSYVPTMYNTSLVGAALPSYTLSYPMVKTWYHVSSANQFKQALRSKRTDNIWIDVDITYTVGAGDIWTCISKKIIDGNGTLTLVGSTTYSTFSANTYVEARLNDSATAGGIYIFRCPVIITGWIAIHYGYIWFDGGIDASVKSSSILYGIKAESSARIYVTFSSEGYANVWPDHTGTERVYYNGQKGMQLYDPGYMVQTIPGTSSVSTNPCPNTRLIIDGGTKTITFVWDPVNVDTFSSMRNKKFYIELNGIGCGDTISFVYPDMDGLSRTVQIIATASRIYGSFKVEQIGAGYVFGIASTKF